MRDLRSARGGAWFHPDNLHFRQSSVRNLCFLSNFLPILSQAWLPRSISNRKIGYGEGSADSPLPTTEPLVRRSVDPSKLRVFWDSCSRPRKPRASRRKPRTAMQPNTGAAFILAREQQVIPAAESRSVFKLMRQKIASSHGPLGRQV